MGSSQTPPTRLAPAATRAAGEAQPRWSFDDDVPLGCESANPALQIERWGQDEAAQPIQQFY